MTDRNGYELSVGDPVLCDGQRGTVVGFGGMGIVVEMSEDGERVDWPSEQVEYDAGQ
jgi:hypothetical protein